ncbi:MAG: tRNA (adenosine(37)-N6)-threonylcarbamoyltransferase complex dimerization subunit type 1 TsaB [Spirochaetaceae bacterium]|nr:MAG: tRNA (adenosine(37)-N6)-threonylcarbamoyltransferase complex dimerization subunit type 1 TsaB [Spirochaetaceae bacterium]
MNILALDTATNVMGIAATTDEHRICIQANIGFHHGESLFPWMDRMFRELELNPKDLNLVICTIGPGSFTGLRIGLSTAKGIALAAECPVVGIPTLDLYAASHAHLRGLVIPLLDARKNRFYTACYSHGKRTSEYLDLAAAETAALAGKDDTVLFTGPDAAVLAPILTEGRATILPQQADLELLVSLGIRKLEEDGPLDPAAGPLYLRRCEAEMHHEEMEARKKGDPGRVT